MKSNHYPEMKIIESDILILGSGAAGCGAAIGAREKNASVVMVDKGKLESSGALGGGNDHFMAVLNEGDETDTPYALVNFFKGPLSGYTESMLLRWAEAMPLMLEVLKEIGVKFAKNPDGSLLRTVGFGQPGAWFINIENGQVIKMRLAKKIRQMGVQVIDHVFITRLIKKDGRVVGAVGFHVLDGTPYVFKAKATILALGNSANRATTNSTGNPYNTWHSPYNTGSQYVLAYEVGAKIINMDIGQQATLLPKSFGSAGMNGINAVGAHELNALGERFMGKYHPMMENGPRRFQIMGTHRELTEGKGPPFYMDMRHCDKDELHHLQYVLMPGDKATFLDYAEQRGIDFARYPMEVELSEIELGGMILTEENFESTVCGLYNGCVFYSFSGSMCSGYIAAVEAGNSLSKINTLPDLDMDEVDRGLNRAFEPMKEKEDGIDYRRFEQAIRQVMNYYMGFVRNEKGIMCALERLTFIEGYTDRLYAKDFRELLRTNEAIHLLKACQLATMATLERKETGRAIYRRSDYPELNPEYAKKVALWQEDGEIKIAWL
ncbi:MAG: FAD-binding protein [Syntrophorhabdaceae bacterium]|nr:FAD-binding protein [Syntrophorhabdaceae bacterium]